jgi:hemerythrin-like domain-containing protein
VEEHLFSRKEDSLSLRKEPSVKCTDLLREDHKIILRSLYILQSMAEQGNAEQIDSGDAAALLHFLRVFVDDYHHIKEESVLFPELMRTSEAQGPPLRHLLFEHGQERSLVGGLEDAVLTNKRAEFVIFANRLASQVQNHIEKEDQILFPIIDVLISNEMDRKVSAEFEKIQLDPDLLADLNQLEWRYLRKTAS